VDHLRGCLVKNIGFYLCASYAPFIYPDGKAGITLRVLLEQIYFIKELNYYLFHLFAVPSFSSECFCISIIDTI
jgi:hypothetical protein